MKDYTKYDFAAIKGAYVEMEIAPTENPTIHATISGMVIYQDPTSILVLRNSGTVTRFLRSEIVPGSLSARIKVEDMTVKQTNYIQNGSKSTFNGNEVLDCTEWGWKHE